MVETFYKVWDTKRNVWVKSYTGKASWSNQGGATNVANHHLKNNPKAVLQVIEFKATGNPIKEIKND